MNPARSSPSRIAESNEKLPTELRNWDTACDVRSWLYECTSLSQRRQASGRARRVRRSRTDRFSRPDELNSIEKSPRMSPRITRGTTNHRVDPSVTHVEILGQNLNLARLVADGLGKVFSSWPWTEDPLSVGDDPDDLDATATSDTAIG